jgi:hypothetical protein
LSGDLKTRTAHIELADLKASVDFLDPHEHRGEIPV